ncbi:hypothetical protein GYMLUDRAFT_53984 [Collybiopsis luxurians FD-317 M1]|nr:hypothetical protein GYMLUDRAFT_53984 [Collybiopsis luxurians FD-317 M1]
MSLQADINLSTFSLVQLYEILLLSSSPKARFTKAFVCTPLAVFEPRSEYECQVILELARREGKVIRVAGVGQSSYLGCSNEFVLRTKYFNRILSIDKEKRRVIAEGGITLHDLHVALVKNNLAMIALGSNSDQSLAGIVTTASYGNDIEYGVTSIISLTLLLTNGSRVRCSRSEQPDLFLAATCGLGSAGIILNVELHVEPSFHLKKAFEFQSFAHTVTNLERIVHFPEHTRSPQNLFFLPLFWFPATDKMCISMLNRTNERPRHNTSWFYDSFKKYHIVQLLLFLRIYVRKFKTWATRLASWISSLGLSRVDDNYCVSDVDCRNFQHTTWTIPYENTKPCLRELREYFHEIFDNSRERPHFSIEIRFSTLDDIRLSPSHDQKTCWIGIVQCKQYNFSFPYRILFDGFECILSRYQGRLHWAKAHKPDAKEEVKQKGSELQKP